MGLDNRDYIRHSQAGGALGGVGAVPPVIKALLAINVAVFLLQLFTTEARGNYSPVTAALSLRLDQVLGGQVWRLITSAFCHSTGQFFHIVFNMLILFFFGREMERKYGSGEFLAFYLMAAVFSSLAYLLVDFLTGNIVPAIGASGAVMGVLILFACNYPRQEILLWFVIRMQIRWLVAILVFMDLVPALAALAGKEFETGIAHAAHLGGMAFGFLYYKLSLSLAPFFRKVSPVRKKAGAGGNPKPRPKKAKLSVSGLSKAEIDARMDELLQKVNEQGIQSLTDKERKFMEDASERL